MKVTTKYHHQTNPPGRVVMELLHFFPTSSISNMMAVRNCDRPGLTVTKVKYFVLRQGVRSLYAIVSGFEFPAHTASKVSYQYGSEGETPERATVVLNHNIIIIIYLSWSWATC